MLSFHRNPNSKKNRFSVKFNSRINFPRNEYKNIRMLALIIMNSYNKKLLRLIDDTKILYLSVISNFKLFLFVKVTYFYINIMKCIYA